FVSSLRNPNFPFICARGSHLQSFSRFKPVLRQKMKVVAAYLLAVLGGNSSPTAEDLKKILGCVGADADEDRIELLLSQVKGKDTTELIAAGMEKLASVPSGGGAGPAASGGAAPAAESKKEEKVEEKEESDDVKFPLPTILPSYD
ncbi:unnamed protein product, partial [Linum tenue]